MAGKRQRERVELPFLSHQVMDYLGALYLLQVGSQVGGRTARVCYVAGALMLLSVTFSGRPLGGGRLPRSVHRVFDIVILAAVGAAPFVFGLTDRTSTVLRLVGFAIAWMALVWFTNYGPPQRGAVRQIARDLRQQAPRRAGRAVGRRMARRRTPGPS